MITYWKNLRIKIDPIEKLRALVLVSLKGRCTCSDFDIREPKYCSCDVGTVALDVAMMHHLSFVRIAIYYGQTILPKSLTCINIFCKLKNVGKNDATSREQTLKI